MDHVLAVLERWDLTLDAARAQVYRAPTLRERERTLAIGVDRARTRARSTFCLPFRGLRLTFTLVP
jgi:hypothetical protein